MKKILVFLLLAVSFTACTNVDPTEVGFLISYSGNYRGVDSLPAVSGWNFYTPGFNHIVTMPTTQQHVVWSESKGEGKEEGQHITVACSGGAGFKMDVGLNYRLNPFKASKVYLKYKTDDLEKITEGYLRNVVRGSMQDISGHITVDSILTNLPNYEQAVRELVAKRFETEGFILDNFSILKQPTPTDPELEKMIGQKIKAKQDAEKSVTELQKSVAEANKKIADARGDSAARVIQAQSEAKEISIKQEALRQSPQYVELIKAQKWDGKLPTVMGSNGGMMLNLKQP